MQPIVARVETAFNGEEALQKAQDKDFDVILLDLNLTGKSGLQLIPEFRDKYPVTKIIIV
jgi:YesN/AraC family two-component response regulator